jgi:hypothetical protein
MSMTYWVASFSSPGSFSRPACQDSGIRVVTSRDTSTYSQTTSKALTSLCLRGILFDGCELALERRQLFLEGLLGLTSPCSGSRLRSGDKDLTKEHGISPEQ